MLDFADLVAINKFDRKGAHDALRDVRKQLQRNREAFATPAERMPVYGTVAARFNDDGVTALYQGLRAALQEHGLQLEDGWLAPIEGYVSSADTAVVPPARARYLAEIADCVRGYHRATAAQAVAARRCQQLAAVRDMLDQADKPAGDVAELLVRAETELAPETAKLLARLAGHRRPLRRRRLRGEGAR